MMVGSDVFPIEKGPFLGEIRSFSGVKLRIPDDEEAVTKLDPPIVPGHLAIESFKLSDNYLLVSWGMPWECHDCPSAKQASQQ